MAYTINKTDGTIVATIADGTIDTSTSLTLFGQNYSGFGELLNENLVKLLAYKSGVRAEILKSGQISNYNQIKIIE